MALILCVDDEPAVRALVLDHLAEHGHEVLEAPGVTEALQILGQRAVDLVLTDYRMPRATGFDLLRELRERGNDVPVIIMTEHTSVEHAVQAIRHGAVDYLTKPLRSESLRIAIQNSLEVERLRRENDEIRREIDTLRESREIVGASAAVREALETVDVVAPTSATVLLEGESGTGKELFARALHERSPRRDHPFLTVNCAAIPDTLVESALFGHERGAFTGASGRALGAFERAHRGTLLLDEISEMRLDLQSKLLRAIQEQEITRVGGHQTIRVDVRIVATTNRELESEVLAGRFRQDLYYRLNVVPIRTPSLRERTEDIPLLVAHFVRQFARQLGIKEPTVPQATLDLLAARPWPGNVRELRNALERALILHRRDSLGPEAFAPRVNYSTLPASEPVTPAPETLVLNLHELEKTAIQRALAVTQGRRAPAAEMLGISERTLRNKLKLFPQLAP